MNRLDHTAIHQRTDERLAGVLCDLAGRMTPVEIYFRYRPQLRDPDDELVLELALNGGAQAIVAHNVRDFLPVIALHGLEVLTHRSIIKERFGP